MHSVANADKERVVLRVSPCGQELVMSTEEAEDLREGVEKEGEKDKGERNVRLRGGEKKDHMG